MNLNLSHEYDHKALVRYGALLLVMTALFKVTGGFAALILPFLVVLAFAQRKPIMLLFWVMFMTMTSIGNRAIFATTGISVLTVRVTLVLLTFILAGKVFASRASRAMSVFWGIMPYMLWEILVSLQGYEPTISYLKLLLFFCIFLAMYGVANEVNASTRINAKILRSVILCIVIFMLVGSVALIPFPGISMMAPSKEAAERMLAGEITSLFCGMCSHSQAMGPMAGVLGTFVFADLLFSIKKWDKLYLLMLLCSPIVCYKTSSRTGMGTLVAGLAMVTFFFVQSRGVGGRWKSRVLSAALMVAVGGAISVVALPGMRDKVHKFILKWDTQGGGRQEINVSNVLISRQSKIDIALYNFRRKPLIGNGFQVSEEMAHEHRSGLFAYLAAPIEKGIWIYAILEEGGVIGFILFAGWLLILFPALYKRHAYVMAGTFFAFMMVNMGEFCVFAMTYVGGFYWTMTFAAGTLDVQRMKNQNLPVFFVPIEQVREEVGYDAWERQLG